MRGRSDGATPPLCSFISDLACLVSSCSIPKPKRQANLAHSASSDVAGPRVPQNATSASSTAALTCRRRSAPRTCVYASARANKLVPLAPGLPSFPFPFSLSGFKGEGFFFPSLFFNEAVDNSKPVDNFSVFICFSFVFAHSGSFRELP